MLSKYLITLFIILIVVIYFKNKNHKFWNAAIFIDEMGNLKWIERMPILDFKPKQLRIANKMIHFDIPCNHIFGDVRPFWFKERLFVITYIGPHVSVPFNLPCTKHLPVEGMVKNSKIHNVLIDVKSRRCTIINYNDSPNIRIDNENFDKNFMPFEYINQLYAVSRIHPHFISRIDPESGWMDIIHMTNYILPSFASGCTELGGSGSPVFLPDQNVMLTLGHTRRNGILHGINMWRKFFFYTFSPVPPFKPLQMSDEIDLKLSNIEFATNIILQGKYVMVSIGVADQCTVLRKFSLTFVMDTLRPIISAED